MSAAAAHNPAAGQQRLRHYFESAVAELLPRSAKQQQAKPPTTAELERFARVFDFRAHADLARGAPSVLVQVDVPATCRRIMQPGHADLITAFLRSLHTMHGNGGSGNGDVAGAIGVPNLAAAHAPLKQLCALFVKHFGGLMDLPMSKAVAATFATYRRAADAADADTAAAAAAAAATVGGGAAAFPGDGEEQPTNRQHEHSSSAKTECTMLLQKALGLSLNSRGDPLGNKRRCLVPLAAQLLRTCVACLRCVRALRRVKSRHRRCAGSRACAVCARMCVLFVCVCVRVVLSCLWAALLSAADDGWARRCHRRCQRHRRHCHRARQQRLLLLQTDPHRACVRVRACVCCCACVRVPVCVRGERRE
jgi:hypothetical protein